MNDLSSHSTCTVTLYLFALTVLVVTAVVSGLSRTSASVIREVQAKARPLMTVQSCKLQYFGRVIRASNLFTEMPVGRVDGSRKQDKLRRRWSDDVKDWSNKIVVECSELASDRQRWSMLAHGVFSDPEQ